MTRFFALPDSNTSPRVTISVLGHVAVSQMDIVQVPYATVTGKYVRALSYGPILKASKNPLVEAMETLAIELEKKKAEVASIQLELQLSLIHI